MSFKATVNWLFNDIWCYLVVGCFDWKIGVFQQTIVRVYYILKLSTCSRGCAISFELQLPQTLLTSSGKLYQILSREEKFLRTVKLVLLLKCIITFL